MKHAKLSPSASHRWLVCPGSVEANANRPRGEHNEHSLRGVTAHALLEVCLRLGVDPERFVGKRLEEDHFEIDEEMAEAVGHALDYVNGYMANNPRAKLLIEHTVYMDGPLGLGEPEDGQYETCFGTGDVIIDNYPTECVNVDYKHGVGITVHVKENSQLRLYAVGQRAARGRYQRYRQAVIQPRLKGRKPIQEHCITDKELMGWVEKKVIPVLDEALMNGAKRVPGDHCKYCHADGNCPGQYELVMQKAKEEFTKDPKGLAPAELAHALDTLALLKKIQERMVERAVVLAHAGVAIPGWQKDFTTPRRKWLDADKAVALAVKMGLPREAAYTAPEPLSPAQMEDAMRAAGKWPKAPRGQPKVNLFEAKDLIGYTETKPSISKTA